MTADPRIASALDALRGLDPHERKLVFKTIRSERETEESDKRERAQMLPNAHWSRKHLLERIPDPSHGGYEQKIHIPEFTFLGVANQPDFGEIFLTFYPSEWTIELKSLKTYKDAFRDSMASYERLANVIFQDLLEIYEPKRLRLVMRLRPRGGISSVITIDSDWAVRGGREEFNDWKQNAEIGDERGHEGHQAVNTTTV